MKATADASQDRDTDADAGDHNQQQSAVNRESINISQTTTSHITTHHNFLKKCYTGVNHELVNQPELPDEGHHQESHQVVLQDGPHPNHEGRRRNGARDAGDPGDRVKLEEDEGEEEIKSTPKKVKIKNINQNII